MVIVATDRVSAYDVILPEGIPNKGKVLTQISSFWFERLSHLVPHHVITTDVGAFPDPFRSSPEVFAGRSMLVRKTRPLAVECVVRGYLSGSGWKEYSSHQSICGIALPAGLRESDRLPEPIFTPASKAELGVHDENITFDQVVETLGRDVADRVRDISIAIYKEGAEYALSRGIIIADTKFEFGLCDDELVLIDEVLTPDSSRFWPRETYQPGGAQKSYDKQYLRDYLISINWDKKPPAPNLPEDVINNKTPKITFIGKNPFLSKL